MTAIRPVWETEPRELDFQAYGLECSMRRGPMGHWCGYVQIPDDHCMRNIHYMDMDVSVHGGLTYGDIHPMRRIEGEYWIGFDCAHVNDFCPENKYLCNGTYRDLKYVRSQCERLAKQIARLGHYRDWFVVKQVQETGT